MILVSQHLCDPIALNVGQVVESRKDGTVSHHSGVQVIAHCSVDGESSLHSVVEEVCLRDGIVAGREPPSRDRQATVRVDPRRDVSSMGFDFKSVVTQFQ